MAILALKSWILIVVILAIVLVCINANESEESNKKQTGHKRRSGGEHYSGFYIPNTAYNAEAYAGSWFAPKQRFFKNIDSVNNVGNLEGASFAIIWGGTTVMTRDFFDFEVVHLSSTTNQIPQADFPALRKELVYRMEKSVEGLKANNKTLSMMSRPQFRDKRPLRHTVAVIPFSTNAVSQYVNTNGIQAFTNRMRELFFQATFWSVYRYFPHIVVCTAKTTDIDVLRQLNLPIWKIVDLSGQVKNQHLLPKHSLQYIYKKLTTVDSSDPEEEAEMWKRTQYVYYTEGDHILHMRSLGAFYNTIDKLNGTVAISPHRMQSIALPKAFPGLEDYWSGHWTPHKVKALANVDLIVEHEATPQGSCCDNGRFVFKQCSQGWWYNCDAWGLSNHTTWIRFGKDGFTLPLGTEHQARCKYSSTRGLCPIPDDCPKSARVPKTEYEICKELPNVEFTYGSKK